MCPLNTNNDMTKRPPQPNHQVSTKPGQLQDVSDPGLVTPEYRAGGGRADYALLGPDGKPVAAVEAKKLGEGLESHRMQMLNYANASGIEYAGLTNGDRWELYDVFQRGPLEERRMLDVSIASGPAHESALALLLLWQPNVASGRQPLPAARPVLGDAQDPAPEPADAGQVSASRLVSPGWVALSEYDPPAKAPRPSAIRFWDGSEQTLKSWYEILTLVVKKLYTEGRLTAEDAPIQWSRSVYSVHTESTHPTGKPFANFKTIDGTPLFVNVNLNAAQVRGNTKRLLQRFGMNPAGVYLQAAR